MERLALLHLLVTSIVAAASFTFNPPGGVPLPLTYVRIRTEEYLDLHKPMRHVLVVANMPREPQGPEVHLGQELAYYPGPLGRYKANPLIYKPAPKPPLGPCPIGLRIPNKNPELFNKKRLISG